MRMMSRAAHRACGWGARSNCQKFYTAGLVAAKRTIPGLWRHSGTCFLLLNSLLFCSCSLGFYSGLTSAFFFVRVTSHRLRSALVSALDSAKYVCYEGPATLFSLTSIAKKRPPNFVLHRRPRVMHVSVTPDS